MTGLTKTSIEWCSNGANSGYTWNFVTGCTKVSAGCKHCYAEGIAKRFWGERKFTDVAIHSERITAPLRLRKPSTVFVNSMSDLFHDQVPSSIIQEAIYIIEATPRVHYIALTKRADRMQRFFADEGKRSDGTSLSRSPLPNLTMGVSIESNATLDRVDYLQRTPVGQRIISFEPLLEEVNALSAIRSGEGWINHAIIGGESGPGARPCYLHWVGSLINQCAQLGIKVFVKQLGAKAYTRSLKFDSERPYKTPRSTKGAIVEEWPEALRVRQLITMPIMPNPFWKHNT